jgi:hypothetical protein
VKEHRLEVADVFREHGEEFLEQWGHTISPQQRKALHDIGLCRTAALGGHVEECDHCAHRTIAYNSCRNRHCPKCQSSARERWLAERAKELLPVPYCHVVFTVPEQLASLALQNQRVFYGLLYRAVSETLQEIAADPRHLGAQTGFLAVLHTWSQSLLHHPHVPLCRAGRWVVPRRVTMDCLSPELLFSARAGPEPAVPREVAGLLAPCLRGRLASVLGTASGSRHACSIPRVASEITEDRVGRLRKTSVWRAGTRIEVSGPLHPSGGHFQQSPVVAGQGPGHVSVA